MNVRGRTGRRVVAGIALVAGLLATTGCDYRGINSFRLPGTVGAGDGAYTVSIEMRDVTNIVQNAPVRVGDMPVGTVAGVDVNGWNAVVTVNLRDDVVLPGNATARAGQTSLLGAKHIELSAPTDTPAQGRLADGAVIPLDRTGAFPATEDVLASTALLLNGGGLEQVKSITAEVNRALGGREDSARSALENLATFTEGLNEQKADIITAIEGLNRFAGTVARERATLEGALDSLPPALRTLEQERGQLVTTLESLGRFGDVASDVINRSKDDLVGNLNDLQPSLRALADSGESLTNSLRLLPTVVFPLDTVHNTFRGDYVSLYATIDLTLGTLDRTWLAGTPAEGSLVTLEENLKAGRGVSGQVTDPLRQPLGLPGAEGGLPLPGAQPAPGAVPEPAAPSGGAPAQPDSPATPPPAGPEPEENSDSGLVGSLLGGGDS
ncbi:MCE-family lipoprotein LprK (MCE-family lipoprotein Mce1e) [Pseudonocardia sp. Ae168_Ps1]|uniref:MCE family protein n=1 Tax=unclassified Pseudonocardia TaxID=2619320 RepID=UPI00094AF9B4|nr:MULTISPECIES: MCE family protein [unclassified Pseudonocardia]OLL73466.1 MCE-family lipoprotein LprK (MCE-family lipoprotein Mce1e) [Pseudonocardia sp. Ae150A_Ps1]OLL79442.1 MCE-family lipoprotein LprK (MCE-family lipoprotein Mce1e) [Pseudonocardia sp. Ae168_Ps1]OLL86423.1 MCE-family lipoprotein LprK (MCE-family lipoprotein Mce1e) [Pseudonocardia sp. Ae263_Ps1]OLL93536.1 MCE-family lipoprotein LprK (MCE-family lipoprotein Mce1e) [Pseudonocardia sp. Ae356_Ps1]